MTVNFGNITSAGCRMLTSVNTKGNLETSATLVKGSTSSTTLANYTAHFKRKNIDGQYRIAQIRQVNISEDQFLHVDVLKNDLGLYLGHNLKSHSRQEF